MAVIDELEAQLREGWDPATAAVYADALQATGDPRGELIAIELQIDTHGQSPALLEARRAAIGRWFGAAPSKNLPAYRVQRGLIDAVVIADLKTPAGARAEAMLCAPGIGHLRSLTVVGDARDVRQTLTILASQPHPWLERLVLEQNSGSPASQSLVEAIETSAPQLRTLELRDQAAMASLPRQVRRLALDGLNTHDEVRGRAIVELDLGFAAGVAPRSIAQVFDAFPKLQRLDLSRNEPGFALARPDDPLVWLGQLDYRDQLRWLRLPSLRRAEQRAALLALLDDHPELTIEIARGYGATSELTAGLAHPRLVIPPPRPWPSPEQFSGRGAYRFQLARHAGLLTPTRCIEVLEAVFDDLPPAARDSWAALWNAMTQLDARTVRPVPAAVLATAVESIPVDLSSECSDVAHMLREAALPEGSTVAMQRMLIPEDHHRRAVRERARLGLSPTSYLARYWEDDNGDDDDNEDDGFQRADPFSDQRE